MNFLFIDGKTDERSVLMKPNTASCSWIYIQKRGVTFDFKQVTVPTNEDIRLMIRQKVFDSCWISARPTPNMGHEYPETTSDNDPVSRKFPPKISTINIAINTEGWFKICELLPYIPAPYIPGMPYFIDVLEEMKHRRIKVAMCIRNQTDSLHLLVFYLNSVVEFRFLVIFTEWISGPICGHEDSSHVRMLGKLYPKHIKSLPFVPIGGAPDGR